MPQGPRDPAWLFAVVGGPRLAHGEQDSRANNPPTRHCRDSKGLSQEITASLAHLFLLVPRFLAESKARQISASFAARSVSVSGGVPSMSSI